MVFDEYDEEAKSIVRKFAPTDGIHSTELASVNLIRCGTPLIPVQTILQPSICFVVDGRKRVSCGDITYDYGRHSYLCVGAELPVVSEILEPSPRAPYLCVQLMVSYAELSDLAALSGERNGSKETIRPMLEVGSTTADIRNTLNRLLALLNTPKRISVLETACRRELLYYIFEDGSLEMPRFLANSPFAASRIQLAVRHIRANYMHALSVDTLHKMSGVNHTTFYKQFRAATGTSPLQYHKRIRLLEARQILLRGSANATQAAYKVGYQSTSHFFRDYARQFGASPRKDVALLKSSALG